MSFFWSNITSLLLILKFGKLYEISLPKWCYIFHFFPYKKFDGKLLTGLHCNEEKKKFGRTVNKCYDFIIGFTTHGFALDASS